MIENYDESLEILFFGELIKYTSVLSKVIRSNYGTGCNDFQNILEYRGELCFISTANGFFRKCVEYFYNKDFSQEYCEFIHSSDNLKNTMTSAQIQPFCKNYNLNLGVYNMKQKTILPRSVTQRKFSILFIYS